jgi:superfamily II RNA helicase
MTTSSISTEQLKEIFPFELDPFQLQAIDALNNGRSVVVSAPTGSGKTLIGEYAIHRAIRQNKRVFYTTPLKALSNQKFRDFREEFGQDSVGLLTGDISINRDAAIVVMTTEIFRNMLYGTRIGEVGTSLIGVEAVVLDECHYMNDKQRGTVWEEVIIYCPRDIQLVALSATVDNSQQLTEWINHVHGKTDLIHSTYRPVPLQFHFCNLKGLQPLLDYNTNRLNPKLKSTRSPEQRRREDVPAIAFVINQLVQREMLPAIYFIFSRRGCDKAVTDLTNLKLVTPEESIQLKTHIDEWLLHNPEGVRTGQLEQLYQGIAAHHAGILPAWKGLVEELFAKGLIKVVFATETLAAGINMPARTTVISSLSKRTDQGHRLLNPSEFLQMAGRAGRRGKDPIGHVVTVQTRFEGAKEAGYLATANPDPLVSQFSPTYGMVLNLLQTHSLEESKELVERSFGQFTATIDLQPHRLAIADLEQELIKAQDALSGVDEKILAEYEELYAHFKIEQNYLKEQQKYFQDVQEAEVKRNLVEAKPGTILSLKGKHVPVATPLSAALIDKINIQGKSFNLVCLGQDNRWYVVNNQSVVGVHDHWIDYVGKQKVPSLDHFPIPEELPLKAGQVRKGQDFTAQLAQQIPTVTEPLSAALSQQIQTVLQLKHDLENHRLWEWGNPGKLLKRYRYQLSIQQQIKDSQEKLQALLARHWQEFVNLIEVLRLSGGLDGIRPTSLGEAAAAIRADNELWVACVLMSGEFDHLDPHVLAAALCTLVSETPRSDSWTNYDPPVTMMEALNNIRGIRRQLFQVQRRHQVALSVWMEWELVGLVEQHALGVSWTELCSNTNLDEGDVVRMLRRTLDLLSQIPYVPHISESLRKNAKRAVQLIDRFPVNEEVV